MPNPGHPSRRHKPTPPPQGRLPAVPTAPNGRCGVGDGRAPLHPLHPRKTASRPRLHAPGTGHRGPLPVFLERGRCRHGGCVPKGQAVREKECSTPDILHEGTSPPPPQAPWGRTHSVQPKLTRA